MLPAEVTWRNWSSVYTDAALWRRPIEQVFARHGLQVDRVRPGFPGTSAAFAVDCTPAGAESAPTRLVVKFYPPMIRPDFDAETQVRSALETCGSKIPFPRILASGLLHDSIDWAYIIEPFCPGQATREVWQGMDLASRENVASQVGWILRDLHSTPLSLLPALNVTAAEWRERARLKLQTCVDEVAAAEMAPGACLPGPLVENLRRFMEASGGPAISSVQDGSLRLLHGDITEDHVLVEPVGGGRWRVSGLIDYGDARVGPLFDEWVVLWLCLFRQDPAALRAFFKTYGEPGGPHPFTPAFGETMLTFTLLHCFNGAIVREVVRRAGVDPSTLTNLCALTQIMWPPA